MTSIQTTIIYENLGDILPMQGSTDPREELMMSEPLPSAQALDAVPTEELEVHNTIHDWPESSNEAVTRAVHRARIVYILHKRNLAKAERVRLITRAYGQAALLSAVQLQASRQQDLPDAHNSDY
jgi:hypothetical protein